MGLTNFGESFASKTLRKFYSRAITPVVANTDYEGEVKKLGDRVNVLMFLEDIQLKDYTVGSSMTVQNPVDTEAQLIIDQKKYYNFDIDVVDKLFTYVDDEDSVLIENASKALEKAVDTRLLQTYIEEVGAGNRVPKKERDGTYTYAVGDTGTYVTITTAATWGIATLTGSLNANDAGIGSIAEEQGCFPTDIVGRGFRVCSSGANSPWYRITARTSSTVLTFNNWDGSLLGEEGGYYVKGMWAVTDGKQFYSPTTKGWGCEIEGMKATQATKTNIYALMCELATALDDADIPSDSRHISVPPWIKNLLIQASELQPDIAMYHEETIVNGKVGRVAGFDVHMVADDRFSTDMEPFGVISEAYGAQEAYKVLANHIGFITFAHKWSESRVKEAEAQFARLYQGLNLYGFKVLNLRRRAGAYLYCYK